MTIPKRVFEDTLGKFFRPVASLLEAEETSEVMINARGEVYVEEGGILRLTENRFPSECDLMAALRNLSQYVGRSLDAAHPILEARFPNGSRVEAVIPPASPHGPVVSIRRARDVCASVDAFVGSGALSRQTAALLEDLVLARRNIIVAGGAGTGKTALLRLLATFIPRSERVVVIEDSTELDLAHPHVVQLEAQPVDSNGRGRVSIRDLFHATLRLRPDRIIIGEIRGGEALELVQAMTSGHRGCLSTLHATHPVDALTRLETMALMSMVDVPLLAVRPQIGAAVDVVVQTSRFSDGFRCVSRITEVRGHDQDSGYKLEDRFVSHPTSSDEHASG